MTYYHVPPNNVVIELLGRTYTIKCTKEEKPQLELAVELVEAEMQKILQGHNHPSPEQLAIVTALNLAVKVNQNTGNDNLHTEEHSQQSIVDNMAEQVQQVLQESAEA